MEFTEFGTFEERSCNRCVSYTIQILGGDDEWYCRNCCPGTVAAINNYYNEGGVKCE
jgi:glutamine amidotransferase-like uncharacterized protein